jgi:hypothetical protein
MEPEICSEDFVNTEALCNTLSQINSSEEEINPSFVSKLYNHPWSVALGY